MAKFVHGINTNIGPRADKHCRLTVGTAYDTDLGKAWSLYYIFQPILQVYSV